MTGRRNDYSCVREPSIPVRGRKQEVLSNSLSQSSLVREPSIPLYDLDYTLGAGSPCIGAASDGEDMGRLFDECDCAPPVVEVTIDIKPGSYPNSINLKSKGVVPVAVLTTDDFDASTVDPSTVLFAGASPLRWAWEDVDGDGDVDVLFHFKTQELNLDGDSTEATLTGETFDAVQIEGTDTVNIVPKGK